MTLSNDRVTQTILNQTIHDLSELIAFDSVSSSSNQAISVQVAKRLERLGFLVETTSYQDSKGVTKCNLLARRDPVKPVNVSSSSTPTADQTVGGLAYFCHTDVVPAVDWTGPGGDPFSAVVTQDRVYGRGACDMKGSLVCMLAAVAMIPVQSQTAPLWIVCTADEEVGFDGARHLVADSAEYTRLVDCQPVSIIGEPTSLAVVHAHKGIEGFQIKSKGRAAHSSTDSGINANDAMMPVLNQIYETKQTTLCDPRYQDPRFDPPHLSWNYGHSDGATAINITPERSTAWISLRTMPEVDAADLIDAIAKRAESTGMTFRRLHGGRPVWIDPDSPWIQHLCRVTASDPITVCYATDGGEFDQLDRRVIFGPGDIAQAHTSDEWIAIEQLKLGITRYAQCIETWVC